MRAGVSTGRDYFPPDSPWWGVLPTRPDPEDIIYEGEGPQGEGSGFEGTPQTESGSPDQREDGGSESQAEAAEKAAEVEEGLIQDVGDEEAEQEKTTPSEKWTTNMITSKLHLPNHHPPPAASFVPACVQE